MMKKSDLCWCGSKRKWKFCHYPHSNEGLSTDANSLQSIYLRKYNILLKNDIHIAAIRKACELTSQILDKACAIAKAGVTTLEINDYVHKLTLEAFSYPAPLHYGHPPFPKSICTSLNDVICHGIPDQTPLKDGDILNIDVSCLLNNYFGDCSRMVMIGNVDQEKKRVVDVSYECLMRSIAILKPGVMIYEIAEQIEAYAALHGCSVVNQFVGHGVGLKFHEEPQVPHHRNAIKIPVAPGMIFTIEPMINAGVREGYIDPQNHWTAKTCDGKPSGQWEHTVLITESGYEILTPWVRE